MASSQALASLTATYTDSEGEEEGNEEEESIEEPQPPPVEISPKVQIPTVSAAPNANSRSSSPILLNTKVPKLVSYHDDTVVSDNESDHYDVDDDEPNPKSRITSETTEQEAHQSSPEPEPPTDDGIQLPPAPKKKCHPDLQKKISRLYEQMQNGIDMNGIIQKRKDFRNPSIYEKLIQFCGIKELGTNYPAEIYDPLKWGKESYFEELAKVQKADMEAREKERKEKTKIEFVSGTKKFAEDEAKRRKSKWDQPGSNASGQTTTLKPAGLVAAPTLTTAATGTKGTVISAFGSLPKKPRL